MIIWNGNTIKMIFLCVYRGKNSTEARVRNFKSGDYQLLESPNFPLVI